jgi:phage N-6-adenine-methyltransferase
VGIIGAEGTRPCAHDQGCLALPRTDEEAVADGCTLSGLVFQGRFFIFRKCTYAVDKYKQIDNMEHIERIEHEDRMTVPKQRPGKSSQTVRTPPELLAAVVRRWGKITWDLAATKENTVAPSFYTEEQNSLDQFWAAHHGVLWCNPPFSNIRPWIEKANSSELQADATLLLLLPASISSEWYAEHSWKAITHALRGRCTFVGHASVYPKDLMLLEWSRKSRSPEFLRFSIWDWRNEK